MSAAKVITWERSTSYVEEKSGNSTHHARCGIIDIAGHYWEGFERLGKVALDAGTYPNSSMYIDAKRGPVVNPWHKQMVPDPDSTEKPPKMKRAGILFHRAKVPSDLLGCVGIGWIYGGQLTDSAEALWEIYRLAGGSKNNAAPVLTVRVIGARTPYAPDSATYLKDLTPYQGL